MVLLILLLYIAAYLLGRATVAPGTNPAGGIVVARDTRHYYPSNHTMVDITLLCRLPSPAARSNPNPAVIPLAGNVGVVASPYMYISMLEAMALGFSLGATALQTLPPGLCVSLEMSWMLSLTNRQLWVQPAPITGAASMSGQEGYVVLAAAAALLISLITLGIRPIHKKRFLR